ncbi:nucleolin 2-like isoform X2 [Stegodyphus dumicola]|nr:nucleolin 2-like isoform X2 [Stegodyphus dumicola]
MSDNKVGVVAATFPKSVASKSESGKKLQSLFEEFYAKNKFKEGDKSNEVANKFQKNKKFNDSKVQFVNEGLNRIGKGKKRKFANLSSSSNDIDGDGSMQHEKKKVKNLDVNYENLQTATDKIKKNEAGITNSLTSEGKCFPRNNKQKSDFVKKPISFLSNTVKKKQPSITGKAEDEEKFNKAYDFSSAKLKFSPFKLVNKNKNDLQDNIFNESNESGNENFENDRTDDKKSKKDSNLSRKKFQNLDSVPAKSKKRKEIKEQEVGESDGSNNAEEECEMYIKDNKKSKMPSNLSKTKFQNLDSVPGKSKKKKEIKKQKVFNVYDVSDDEKKECETFVKNENLSKKKFQNINGMKSSEKDKNVDQNESDDKKSKNDSNMSKTKFQNLDSVPGKSKKKKEIKKQKVFNVYDVSDDEKKECETFVKNEKLSKKKFQNIDDHAFNGMKSSEKDKNVDQNESDDKKSKKDSNMSKTKFQNLDSVPGKSKKKKEIKKQKVFNVYYVSDDEKKECETFVKNEKLSKKNFQDIDDDAFNSMKSPKKDKNVNQNGSESESNSSDEEGFKDSVEAHKGKKNKKLSKKKNKISKKVDNVDKSMEFQSESAASDSEHDTFNKLREKKVKNTSSPVNMLNKKESENFISPSANDEPEEGRTVSVGNLPILSAKKILFKLFSPFGPIETIRLRGAIPVKPNMPMKVAEITESFHSKLHNLRGFVTFKERSSAVESLILNGTLVDDRHIFVDLAGAPGEKRAYDDKRTIFVGNLPFDVEEETIWSTFSQCGLIERIRVVRDRITGAGKGIAYVLFHKTEAKEKALTLKDVEIGNRNLRIQPVERSNHKKEENAHNSKSSLNSFKSKAIRMKRNLQRPNSRKTIKKMEKKIKKMHKKKKIASQFKNMI